jgi:hypothetical protein
MAVLHLKIFSPTNGKAVIHTHFEKCHIFDLEKEGIFGIPRRLFWTLSQSSLKPKKLGQMESLH